MSQDIEALELKGAPKLDIFRQKGTVRRIIEFHSGSK